MKLNRKWILVVAMLLSLTMATTGTLAFLTDRDTVENTFTMGNVDIELKEDFPTNPPPIKPGETVNKDAWIENDGEKNAWVWMTVSVPSTLGEFVTPNWNTALDLEDDYKVSGPATLGDETVWTVLVNDELEADEVTPEILDSVTLSGLVDYQNGKYVVVKNGVLTDLVGLDGNKLNVTVNAYAVQADGVANVQDAYNAYNAQWNVAGIPVALVTEFGDDDTLTKMKDGEVVTILDKNRTVKTHSWGVAVDDGEIQMDAAYQFKPTMSATEAVASGYKDWHADFVVYVDKDIPEYGIGLAGYYDLFGDYLEDNTWVMLAANEKILANTEIRLLEAMGGFNVSYEEICSYGNDGIGFLCGAVALNGESIDGTKVSADVSGTKLTVELRLYEATGNGIETESGEYIVIGTSTYTFK